MYIKDKIRLKEIIWETQFDWNILESIDMFKHLDRRTQDRFMRDTENFPKLKSYLIELQLKDECILTVQNKGNVE